VSAALDPAAAARALVSARQAGRTLDVLLSSEAGLSLADAYRVQDQVTALRLAGGERRTGWKLGYTSAVMRAQMGIDAPNFGPLTDAMLLSSPAVLPAGALQPRIEPEIGLRLGRRLAGPCSVSDVLAACDAALACLEVVDSVWSGYRFTLEDNTADGSSAAWVVVGPVMELDDLASLPVALSVDGSVVERGVGAAASGHPAAGVAWLAEQLSSRGLALEPGDLAITGGLTSAHPLEPGHRISASFGDGRWSVEVRRRELAGQGTAAGSPAGSSSSGLGWRASLLGHHTHRPRSRFSAVTSTERTTSVSSSTPNATAKPSSVRNVTGRVPSTANVPASTAPAAVITPPVAARPVSAPVRAPWRLASSRTLVIRKML
jgi:2-keto-4-pentenoate hydratase